MSCVMGWTRQSMTMELTNIQRFWSWEKYWLVYAAATAGKWGRLGRDIQLTQRLKLQGGGGRQTMLGMCEIWVWEWAWWGNLGPPLVSCSCCWLRMWLRPPCWSGWAGLVHLSASIWVGSAGVDWAEPGQTGYNGMCRNQEGVWTMPC